MSKCKIREIQSKMERGALCAEAIEENLSQVATFEGAETPVLCRTTEEVAAADRIEWTELMDAVRRSGVPEPRVHDIEQIRERYCSTPIQRDQLFADLGRMPPTVGFAIAMSTLGEIDESSKALTTVEAITHIRRDLLALNDKNLCEKLRAAVSLRPVHAFLRREHEDKILERAEELDRMRRAGESLPLAGVAIGVKDVFALGRTTAASRILHEYVAPPEYVATAVGNLLAAGAVSMGKTNLDEFALGSSCTSTAYWPATRNPHDTARIPGGSSGGSVAAVASGMVLGAIASDTAGSIRLPASYCGVVGVKPTYGLVSRYGLLALASSLDCVGPIASNVADAALLLGHMVGNLGAQRDPRDQTMRWNHQTPKWDPEIYARPFLQNCNWSKALRGLRVGIPIEYFLSYDLDDRTQVEELLSTPNAFESLMDRTGERRSARQVGQLVDWMSRSGLSQKSVSEDQVADFWGQFAASAPRDSLGDARDKLARCPSLWLEIQDLVRRLHQDYGVEFQLVSMRHTWLSIPIYFIMSRQEVASNLHRYDGLKYGRKQVSLAETFEVAAARNRSVSFGTQPKQRILMGIHALSASNLERLLRTARRARRLIRHDFEQVFSSVDLLLTPTVNTVAPIPGGFADTVAEQYMDEFTVPANHAGVPAISVPLYREQQSKGWQSVQVIAGEFDEARMFLLAAAIEECRLQKEAS